ncbi:MAG: uroporphyrinogen-III synthase, partial [Acidimicrobiales bacterium]
KIAEASGRGIRSLVIGSGVGDLAAEFASKGGGDTLVVDDAALAHYNVDGHGRAIRAAVEAAEADLVLISNTPTGWDVAPRVAAALDRPLPSGVNVAVVGPGTARRARDVGLPGDLVPSRAIAEGLVEAFPDPPAGGGRVVFARAAAAREVLAPGLRERGWRVDEVVAYLTVGRRLTPTDEARVRAADAVALTSSSTVDHLVGAVGTGAVPDLVGSIGPITSATARARGLQVTVEAGDHTIAGLVTALVEQVTGAHR